MKKIIAFIICLMVCCVPLVASAEGAMDIVVTEGVIEGDITTPEGETPSEEEIQPPVETPEEPEEIPDENPTETPEENPVETLPEETPKDESDLSFEEEVELVTAKIEAWITENIEEIGVIVTLIGYGIVIFTRVKALIKSTGTINNNAISISKASSDAIAKALANMENTSNVVSAYDVRMAAMLEAFKTTAEDKAKLERELVEIKNYLATSTKSNLVFADEFMELLSLANIPNYKKEELGAKFVAAKREIIDAETKAEIEADNAAKMLLPITTEEVKENVGEES